MLRNGFALEGLSYYKDEFEGFMTDLLVDEFELGFVLRVRAGPQIDYRDKPLDQSGALPQTFPNYLINPVLILESALIIT